MNLKYFYKDIVVATHLYNVSFVQLYFVKPLLYNSHIYNNPFTQGARLQLPKYTTPKFVHLPHLQQSHLYNPNIYTYLNIQHNHQLGWKVFNPPCLKISSGITPGCYAFTPFERKAAPPGAFDPASLFLLSPAPTLLLGLMPETLNKSTKKNVHS